MPILRKNDLTYVDSNKLIDTENKLVVTRGEDERDKIGEGN